MGTGLYGDFGLTIGLKKELVAENKSELLNSCPISIPKKAKLNVQSKDGYVQVKYTRTDAKFNYTVRWHSKTPNSPPYENDSWVVERKIPGIGYGKNARKAESFILVKGNKRIEKEIWQDAIRAKKNKTITKKQKELLKNGHWK